jgi:aryl-alcohol dehydrogenase-like predicted oxidoreductase
VDAPHRRRVGASGLQVSVVGLGCNNFGRRVDATGAARVVHAALDAGIDFFDTSDTYGPQDSERMLGAALTGRRHDAVIATKFGMSGAYPDRPTWRGGSRLHVRRAVEGSLSRLGTDYIDLYQLHTPDPQTPIEETLATLDDLVREGKVRYIGSSNFNGWQIADADWTARSRGLERFVSAQNHYSLLERAVEKEVVPACERFGLGLIPFFPLASGVLTGKYRRGQSPPEGTRLAASPNAGRLLTDRNFDIMEALERFAAERQLSLLEVAIGGLAAQPSVVSVIAGATRPEQVQANAAAAAWSPATEDLEALNKITSR